MNGVGGALNFFKTLESSYNGPVLIINEACNGRSLFVYSSHVSLNMANSSTCPDIFMQIHLKVGHVSTGLPYAARQPKKVALIPRDRFLAPLVRALGECSFIVVCFVKC